jgi:hypothetical protein
VDTPFDSHDVGNWSETLGLGVIFLESTLLGLSIYAITGRRRSI